MISSNILNLYESGIPYIFIFVLAIKKWGSMKNIKEYFFYVLSIFPYNWPLWGFSFSGVIIINETAGLAA